jgi:hypothetical protein
MVIGPGARMSKLDQSLQLFTFDDRFSAILGICPPDSLLFQDSFLSAEFFMQDCSSSLGADRSMQLAEDCLSSTRELLRTLRLFNPGRLRAGETFIMMRDRANESWVGVASHRVSEMTVDYSSLALEAKTYFLSSSEIPSLRAFHERLLPALRQISSFPAVEFALVEYGADDGDRSDLTRAVAALEALLTKRDETEGLTYRLSMRIANLLGNDADARKKKFEEVKRFYNLRSRVVHGSLLKQKELSQLGELYSLRETLRRVLLSVIALFSEGVHPDDLPGLLDELALDDEKRTQVQATAAKYLHIDASVCAG